MPVGKSVLIVEHGHFSAVPSIEPTSTCPARRRKFFLASELTYSKKHLTSRSSRSLRSLGHSALRTCSGLASPLSPEHSALRTCSGLASPLSPDQALRAECRLPGR